MADAIDEPCMVIEVAVQQAHQDLAELLVAGLQTDLLLHVCHHLHDALVRAAMPWPLQ